MSSTGLRSVLGLGTAKLGKMVISIRLSGGHFERRGFNTFSLGIAYSHFAGGVLVLGVVLGVGRVALAG